MVTGNVWKKYFLWSLFIIVTVLSGIAIVGPGASAITVNQDYLYVAGSNVTAISVADTSVKITINNVSDLGHIAVSPDGKKVYVSGSDGINVIDTSTSAAHKVATGYSSYWGIAVNPAGNEYYVGVHDVRAKDYRPYILVMNAYTDTEVMRFNTSPHGTVMNMAVSPDGTKLYACSQKSNRANVTLYNLTNRAEVSTKSIPLSDDIAVNPSGREFYVACADSENFINILYVFNASSNAIKNQINDLNGPTGVAVSPDGSRLFVTNNYDDSFTVINTASGEKLRTYNLSRKYPDKIAITPDGKKMFISHGRDVNGVSLVNLTDYSMGFISLNNTRLHEMAIATVPVTSIILPHLPTISPPLALSPIPAQAPTPSQIPSPIPSIAPTGEPSTPPIITDTPTITPSPTTAPTPGTTLPVSTVTETPVASASPAVPASTPGFEAVMAIVCLSGLAYMGRKR